MISRIIRAIARADIFAYCCGWLVVLLVVGTLTQRNIGLYLAQERYFSSWFAMFGPIPLPGGRLTMAVVFICLTAYLTQRKVWSWRKSGLLITHIGALLLLMGGFLTAYFSSEGSMLIYEGKASNYVSDYHAKEIAITGHGAADYDEVTALGESGLKSGKALSSPNLPGTFEVIEYFRNCRTSKRQDEPSEEYKGIARHFMIQKLAQANESSDNQAGATLRLTGAGDADGIYLLVEGAARPESFRADDQLFDMILRRARTYLPFHLELIDFEKQVHPGTRMARSYKSVVNLVEGDLARRVVIQMNEPLRLHGLTFFQSSFIEGGPSEATVLAVVKNYGRLFPYISSLVMCFGLLVHLGMMAWLRPRSESLLDSPDGSSTAPAGGAA